MINKPKALTRLRARSSRAVHVARSLLWTRVRLRLRSSGASARRACCRRSAAAWATRASARAAAPFLGDFEPRGVVRGPRRARRAAADAGGRRLGGRAPAAALLALARDSRPRGCGCAPATSPCSFSLSAWICDDSTSASIPPATMIALAVVVGPERLRISPATPACTIAFVVCIWLALTSDAGSRRSRRCSARLRRDRQVAQRAGDARLHLGRVDVLDRRRDQRLDAEGPVAMRALFESCT